jgi:hypothetical protein
MHLLEGGVIVHHLDNAVVVTADVAGEVVALTADLAAGEPVAVVVDLGNIAFADSGTRAFFAQHDADGVEVATALVAGPRVAQFLARRWREDARPARPTSMFEDLDEAIAWAREALSASWEASGG